MLSRPIILCCIVSLAGMPGAPTHAKEPDHPVYTDPANAGPDYSIQGEYAGTRGPAKVGAQVIADGDGQFQVVLLTGGLPGDGWDGHGRVEAQAHRAGEKVEIAGGGGLAGTIDGHSIHASAAGESISLKKVERESPDAGANPPAGAEVLFDGSSVDAWQNGKIDARHLLVDGARTRKKYQSFTMHVEFLLPFKPFARDQERGNSGIYVQDRYEVQILDTFGHPAEFNGCGSMYRQHAPRVNMCYPPLRWQTYDIEFQAARFDAAGHKTRGAVITVKHNGVVVQDHYTLTSKTGAGHPESPEPGPIWLQDHHNPVFFRNIWIVDGGAGQAGAAGQQPTR